MTFMIIMVIMIIAIDLIIDARQKPFILQICRLKDSCNRFSVSTRNQKLTFLQKSLQASKLR